MAKTGVKLDSEVLPLINSMNMDKLHKYAIFEISKDKKFIRLRRAEDQDPKKKTKTKDEDRAAFNAMKESMIEENIQAAYILYDFSFTSDKLGREVEQLVFLNFCLEDANGILKMLHAGSKNTLKESAKAVQLEFEAHEWNELDYDTFSAGVEAKKRV